MPRSVRGFAVRGVRRPRRTPTNAWTVAGPSSSTASFAVRIDRERVGRYTRAASRWLRLLRPGRPSPGPRGFYGHARVPGPGEPVAGGTPKLQQLAARVPDS